MAAAPRKKKAKKEKTKRRKTKRTKNKRKQIQKAKRKGAARIRRPEEGILEGIMKVGYSLLCGRARLFLRVVGPLRP